MKIPSVLPVIDFHGAAYGSEACGEMACHIVMEISGLEQFRFEKVVSRQQESDSRTEILEDSSTHDAN